MARIAVGGMQHETNTFAPSKADYAAFEDGGGWLLVVERPGGGRLLLPYVESFVRRVDPGAGRIEWALPEGLIEACASGS